jgi:hypothetical protein
VSKSHFACDNRTLRVKNHTRTCQKHNHACGNHSRACENHTLRAEITLVGVEITLGRLLYLQSTRMRVNYTRKRVIFTHLRVNSLLSESQILRLYFKKLQKMGNRFTDRRNNFFQKYALINKRLSSIFPRIFDGSSPSQKKS